MNGSTSLSFTLQNNNSTLTLTGVGFIDCCRQALHLYSERAHWLLRRRNNHWHSRHEAISLSGASLTANSTCTFSVNVTGIAAVCRTTHGQCDFDRGGRGRYSFSQRKGGSTAVHREGLQSFNDLSECDELADVYDYQFSGERGPADWRGIC